MRWFMLGVWACIVMTVVVVLLALAIGVLAVWMVRFAIWTIVRIRDHQRRPPKLRLLIPLADLRQVSKLPPW